ncbi:aldehyde dehydrogenase (NADP(+)), partial [Azospirillum sp. 412522]|nr:aldehyde dehydrogenase (NADP(+)) [Azospirillum sp. 412522]
GPDLDRFVGAATEALGGSAASTMLTPGIHAAYDSGVAKLAGSGAVTTLGRGLACSGPNQAQAAFFTATAEAFLADTGLQEEVFGAASLLIRCPDVAAMTAVAEKLEGQLTATLQMDAADKAAVAGLIPTLERKAGRILANGWPTGVEVCHAMVHGGPFPATSDPRSTSVGTLAIRRFLRPVCYQDIPADLLPEALRDGNPQGIWRRIDGTLGQE